MIEEFHDKEMWLEDCVEFYAFLRDAKQFISMLATYEVIILGHYLVMNLVIMYHENIAFYRLFFSDNLILKMNNLISNSLIFV